MHGSWDMKRDRQNFLSFWAIFCHFTPLTAQKIKIKKKKNEKHAWRYHHFTQVYQNHDQMLHCSWDMTCNGCKCYFSFWAIFCPFTSLKAQKIKIKKNGKKRKEISLLYTRTKNYDQMMYGSWDMMRHRRTEKMTYTGGCPT